jgi:hypothetical protein
VNAIGLHKKQGQAFRFLNCRQEPYEWMDVVPEDDPEFQGLLEEDKEAAYPDISAEPPGVELESEETDYAAVTDEPEPDFEQSAATALDNAGIDPQDCLRAAQAAAAAALLRVGPALVEADDNEIVCKITLDLPNAGLAGGNVIQDNASPPPTVEASILDMADETVEILTNRDAVTTNQRYPLQSCRSAIGHQPYDTYALRMTFLQLGKMRAHRSVLDATQYVGMTREEWMHATTWSETAPPIDDTEHTVDLELVTDSEDEMKVWGYLMTQYNLKPDLRKFRLQRQGRKGCDGQTNTTTHNGYLDGHGSIKNRLRGPHASTLFATLPEREVHRKN